MFLVSPFRILLPVRRMSMCCGSVNWSGTTSSVGRQVRHDAEVGGWLKAESTRQLSTTRPASRRLASVRWAQPTCWTTADATASGSVSVFFEQRALSTTIVLMLGKKLRMVCREKQNAAGSPCRRTLFHGSLGRGNALAASVSLKRTTSSRETGSGGTGMKV